MYVSVVPDIKWTLPCQLLSTKSDSNWPSWVNEEGIWLEDSPRISVDSIMWLVEKKDKYKQQRRPQLTWLTRETTGFRNLSCPDPACSTQMSPLMSKPTHVFLVGVNALSSYVPPVKGQCPEFMREYILTETHITLPLYISEYIYLITPWFLTNLLYPVVWTTFCATYLRLQREYYYRHAK